MSDSRSLAASVTANHYRICVRFFRTCYRHMQARQFAQQLRQRGWLASLDLRGGIFVLHADGENPDPRQKPRLREPLHPSGPTKLLYASALQSTVTRRFVEAGWLPYGPREYFNPGDIQKLRTPFAKGWQVEALMRWRWELEIDEEGTSYLVPISGRMFVSSHVIQEPMIARWASNELGAGRPVRCVDIGSGARGKVEIVGGDLVVRDVRESQRTVSPAWRPTLSPPALEQLGCSREAKHIATLHFSALTEAISTSVFAGVCDVATARPLARSQVVVVSGNCLRFRDGAGRTGADVLRRGVLEPPPGPVRLLVAVESERLARSDTKGLLAAHLLDPVKAQRASPHAGRHLERPSFRSLHDVWTTKLRLSPFSVTKPAFGYQLHSGKLIDQARLCTEVEKARTRQETVIALLILETAVTSASVSMLRTECSGIRRVQFLMSVFEQPQYAIANLAVALSEAAGAVPWELDSKRVPAMEEGTFIVGMDLGHHHAHDKSRLAITLVDCRGRRVKSRVVNLPRNDERIPRAAILEHLRPLLLHQSDSVRRVIIHRDGRFLKGERDDFIDAFRDMEALALVAVKKDTLTRFTVPSPTERDCTYVRLSESRALLTSTKLEELPVPIEVEVEFSNCWDIDALVSQVFWLTRAYSRSTSPKRLPVSTSWANSIARTGRQ